MNGGYVNFLGKAKEKQSGEGVQPESEKDLTAPKEEGRVKEILDRYEPREQAYAKEGKRRAVKTATQKAESEENANNLHQTTVRMSITEIEMYDNLSRKLRLRKNKFSIRHVLRYGLEELAKKDTDQMDEAIDKIKKLMGERRT